MIYKNVELHNVEETAECYENSGVMLSRFPSDVIDVMKGRGAYIARSNTGCEIRFISSAKTIWLTMEAAVEDTEIYIFCGDFKYDKRTLSCGKKTTIELIYNNRFDMAEDGFFDSFPQRFPHNLWRIYINNERSHCIFYEAKGLDGYVRPPHEGEIDLKKWLAYGSSITHGVWAENSLCSYIQHAAAILDADVLCKGMSGACMCEREMADYLASAEWDFISLELGVNMYGFRTKEFKKRAEYMISKIHEQNPEKKIFVISPFPNLNSFGRDKDIREKHIEYEKILCEASKAAQSENVIFISGDRILTSPSFLSADLVHPSDHGHIRMGDNLAKIMKEYI